MKFIKKYFPHTDTDMVEKIINICLEKKAMLIGGIVFMLLYALFNVLPAALIKPIIDSLGQEEEIPISRFLLVASGLVLIVVFKGISYFGQNYLMSSIGQWVVFSLRQRLFEKIVHLPLKFFNSTPTGHLINRFSNDMNALEQSIQVMISGPMKDAPQVVMLMGIMLYRSPELFVISLVTIASASVLIKKFSKKAKEATRLRLIAFDGLTHILQEGFTGIRVIKNYVMEKYEIARFKEKNRTVNKNYMSFHLVNSYSTPILEVIGAVCICTSLVYGGYLYNRDEITAGDLVSFLVCFFTLVEPIKKLNGFFLKLNEGLVSASRIGAILNESNTIIENNKSMQAWSMKDSLRIKIDRFDFTENQRPILANIDVTIPKNKTVAFIGSSGSGKTTLTNLILRLFDLSPDQGQILFDGVNIKELDIFSWRMQTSAVTQDTILFLDSVKNNIAHGRSHYDDAQIIESAKMAYAHEFIEEMDQGYDTQVGEKGSRLSGGQKQRISIARALLKRGSILILDEATSSLDNESEKLIHQSIEKLMGTMTIIIVAHRLSTVKNADVIYVMDSGEIIESGNHDELIRNDGLYRKLYEMNHPA